MLHTFLPSTKIIILLLLLLVLISLVAFAFNQFKKSSTYEIVGTREFSCSSMKDFTFQYPVFKRLEGISQDLCELRVGETDTNWTIFVISVDQVESNFPKFDQVNPNGIHYTWSSDKNGYIVKLEKGKESKIVEIRVGALPMYQTKRILMIRENYLTTIINTLKPSL